MIEIITAASIGIAVGGVLTSLFQRMRLRKFHALAEKIIRQAERDAEQKVQQSALLIKAHELEGEKRLQESIAKEESKWQRREDKIQEREEALERRTAEFSKKERQLEEQKSSLQKEREEVVKEKEFINQQKKELINKFESCAAMTETEAKATLLKEIEGQVKIDAASHIRKRMQEAEEQADEQAKKVLIGAMGRLALPTTSQATVKSISLPNDEIKGRIIGKEGRNIRTFEKATGITVLVDDTPRSAVLSGFDPVRLEIAKRALELLVVDGRVHPTRIEEVVQTVKEEVEKEIINYGRDAAVRVGAIDLSPTLLTLLGKMKFRTTNSQNLLDHSLEVAHLMELMARELQLNCRLAARIGLLHDIGKAASHEIKGSHAHVGYTLALRHGESEQVANGIGCHHKEMEAITLEGSLCSIADTLSASRPGARSGSLDEYIQRQEELEKIACGFPGVEKAFALQAGREIRVFVFPDMVDDLGLAILARDLSKRIEKQVKNPGSVKISVTREKQVVEYL